MPVRQPSSIDIEGNVTTYIRTRTPAARYTSFDYCFNYFQSHRGEVGALASPTGMQLSCLHLWAYLASWGMLRGPALLASSMKCLAPVIDVIVSADSRLWQVDAHNYTFENIDLILDLGTQVGSRLPRSVSVPTKTSSGVGVAR